MRAPPSAWVFPSLFLVAACARSTIADLPRDGAPEHVVAFDTELACRASVDTPLASLPFASATWRDVAARASQAPPDPAAVRAAVDLMRANRQRYSDSACTARRVSAAERDAERRGAAPAPGG